MRNAICCAAASTLIFSVGLRAGSNALKAEVSDVRGPATFTMEGGAPRALQPGTDLPVGALIKTGVGAAVDISLGRNVGWIRLPENTVLNIGKLSAGASGDERAFDIQLGLPEGALLGDVRDVSEGGKFDVKTPVALAGVRGGKFRIQAEGYVVVLSGTVLNVHISPSGEPSLHKVTAPPPAYFSPTEGVRPAPPPLTREVQAQIQARFGAP